MWASEVTGRRRGVAVCAPARAFKTVLDGKPTELTTNSGADHRPPQYTGGKKKHIRTFQPPPRRGDAIPVTIELLSRFRSRAEQKEVVAKAADGSVDILIATHRILGEDSRVPQPGAPDRVDERSSASVVARRTSSRSGRPESTTCCPCPRRQIPRSLHLRCRVCATSRSSRRRRDRLAMRRRSSPRGRRSSAKRSRRRSPAGARSVRPQPHRVDRPRRARVPLEELLPAAHAVRVTVAHGQMTGGGAGEGDAALSSSARGRRLGSRRRSSSATGWTYSVAANTILI